MYFNQNCFIYIICFLLSVPYQAGVYISKSNKLFVEYSLIDI